MLKVKHLRTATAWSPASARTRTARASARCCSASTTTTARCITSGSRRASRRRAHASSSTSSSRTAPTRSRITRGATGPSSAAAIPTNRRSGQRMPGAPSRWNAKKDMSWEPLRIELVAEVAYEHLQGDRFRHTARFQRWRPDRDPSSCTLRAARDPRPDRARGSLRQVDGVRSSSSSSSPGSAARVSARRASSGSSVATARRPGPPLVARREVEQRLERVRDVVDRGRRVTDRRVPRRYRRERQVARVRVGQLVPGERARHPTLGVAAHRVGRGDGAVTGVLVVVDEHLLAPLLLPPLRRRERRHPCARRPGRARAPRVAPRGSPSGARSGR